MLLPLCFVLLNASNMDNTHSKMLIQTSKLISVVDNKKHTTIKLAGPQYESSYDVKESSEEIHILIKKECK